MRKVKGRTPRGPYALASSVSSNKVTLSDDRGRRLVALLLTFDARFGRIIDGPLSGSCSAPHCRPVIKLHRHIVVLWARNSTSDNNGVVSVDATQAGEITFALLLEVFVPSAAWPNPLGWTGTFLSPPD